MGGEILDKTEKNYASNTYLGEICKDLFFDPNSSLGGNVGVYVLGERLSEEPAELQDYLVSLENTFEPELSQ